jgi:hypothetical protein
VSMISGAGMDSGILYPPVRRSDISYANSAARKDASCVALSAGS